MLCSNEGARLSSAFIGFPRPQNCFFTNEPNNLLKTIDRVRNRTRQLRHWVISVGDIESRSGNAKVDSCGAFSFYSPKLPHEADPRRAGLRQDGARFPRIQI